MPQKPPAFQFYAKDWLTSETICGMRLEDEGTYIRLLAASWISTEPGTLPLPLKLAAKLAQVPTLRLGVFLERNPTTFIEKDGRLVNLKLYAQWLHMKDVREKRADAGRVRHRPAIAKQMHPPASAVASATATKVKDVEPKTIVRPKASDVILPEDFLQFWQAYPRHEGKAKTLSRWKSLPVADRLAAFGGINRWKDSGRWDDLEFVPMPLTYLNGRRWEDEITAKGNGNGKHRESYEERLQRENKEVAERVAARYAPAMGVTPRQKTN